MKTLKRIWNFDEQDMKHVGWLFKLMIKNFINGHFDAMKENWFWIKIHCTYDSERIE